MVKHGTFARLAVLVGLVMAPAAAFAASPNGIWTSGDGKARIKVDNCGANLCGHIVWLRTPRRADGSLKLDQANANPALRKRPIVGVPVLEAMVPDNGTWRGKIYNADDGKTYSATFQLVGASQAKVQGCVLGILCKTQVWTRN